MSSTSNRRPVAAVIGSASTDDATYEAARLLGRMLVDAGFRVVCGGLSGVMEAACRGAQESDAYASGDTIAILPTYDAGDANEWVDIAIPTGMAHGRNTLVAASGDVVIAVEGGAGTLNEISAAWALGRPVIALACGGWAERLAGESLDTRRPDVVHGPFGVPEAVAAASELVGVSHARASFNVRARKL